MARRPKPFEREAMAMAKLEHPHCASVLDVGVHGDRPYVVMEFVTGQTLKQLLDAGPLPIPRAVDLVRQILSGLAHAHEHGIIHRDIKPDNIMLTEKGEVKLADFGLARGQQPSDLTLEHASIGTPQYVAPEQMRRGSDATPRSDLFSLGSTLYHMVTGRPPPCPRDRTAPRASTSLASSHDRTFTATSRSSRESWAR